MSGLLTRAALALEPYTSSPVWPAAAPVAVSRLLPILSENVRDVPVRRVSARREPRIGRPAAVRTATRVEGPVQLQAVYDGLSDVWAMCLGIQHAERPDLVTGGVYRHLFEVDPILNSHAWPFGAFEFGAPQEFGQQLVRRGTFVVDRTVSAWEHLSMMVRSLTLNATPNGVTLLLNVVAHSTDRSSVTNANLNGLSVPEWPVVSFTELDVRLAPISDVTPLDADDAIDITGFTMNLSQNLRTRQRRDTGLSIGEPRRTEHPSVGGTLGLPECAADTLIDWAQSNTVLMARLQFTGEEIGASGENYALSIYLPALQLDTVEAGTQGAQSRNQSLNWRAVVSDTVPAGFPTPVAQGPLYVEVTSTESINPLIGV